MGADSNDRSPSTTTRWGWTKIGRRPEGPSNTGPKDAPPLSQWPARDPLSITIRYRGGAECWWEIKARGRDWRFPGVMCIHDVFDEIEGRR